MDTVPVKKPQPQDVKPAAPTKAQAYIHALGHSWQEALAVVEEFGEDVILAAQKAGKGLGQIVAEAKAAAAAKQSE